MQKPTSPFSNQNSSSAATATSSTTVENQNYVSPPPSPLQNHHQYYHQDITTDFASMYNFSFPPKSPLPHSLSLTPSSCASLDDLHINLKLTSDAIATERRLNQARLILEYQQLCYHFDLCFARLQDLFRELETLRIENSDLRVANNGLIKLLSLSSQAATKNRNLEREEPLDLNVKRWERRNNNAQRNSLPKSVSVRSTTYLQVNREQGSSDQQRVVNPSVRVYVPHEATRSEDKAIELEVYNQGMVKTELCNKWQETGTCPYAQNCQFAHGITQLRPVIRHPTYKTKVCRMVLAGQTCPYGHRCHFRHSLTDQERLLISR
ncbi:zinc finger CCCH domain-containing protein 14-like [Durio zibethinus]|uniref:Zinc finger CCCH domain-containing protein 14-like n=1 Tax=Durio zibethinus TaxID=66656 RepID=A0A6P6AYQ8_DURZI|nr:zinc finger CCCH domain-containing protein 14-like [Durio zibethinus]